MITFGIDPGITGAVSVFRGGELQKVFDLPTISMRVGKGNRTQMVPAVLAQMFLDEVPYSEYECHAYLEQVSSRPGEGAVGAFSFGRGFGQIEGILAGHSIPFTLVTPGKWKKALGVSADKGHARMRAAREFPAFAAQFARVKDDGRAEACLIGMYALQLSVEKS